MFWREIRDGKFSTGDMFVSSVEYTARILNLHVMKGTIIRYKEDSLTEAFVTEISVGSPRKLLNIIIKELFMGSNHLNEHVI